MKLEINPLEVPLYTTEQGVVRIKGHRIGLDLIVHAFQRGITAEEMVEDWPTLDLEEVYAILAFYLYNRVEVNAYLDDLEREADEIQRKIEASQHPNMLRERLKAERRKRELEGLPLFQLGDESDAYSPDGGDRA